jgi:hypothetical protein
VRIEFPDRRILSFDFPVIELPKLEARDFVRKENAAALALAGRMKFRQKEQADLITDFAETLAKSPVAKAPAERAIRYFFACQRLKQRALKLGEEMGNLSPVSIGEKALDRLNPFVLIGERRGIERGIQKGIRQGRRVGEREPVLRLLHRRLGPLPEARRRAIEHLPRHKV